MITLEANKTPEISPLISLKPKTNESKKSSFNSNRLGVKNNKETFKKASSSVGKRNNIAKPENSNLTSNSSEHNKSGGVLKYMLGKINKKGRKNLNKPPVLDSQLGKMLDRKIISAKDSFQNSVKFQKFMIVNALLKKFHMTFQKRIEYQILFSYVKNIINMLVKNLERFKKTKIKKREEPTVVEFRQIHEKFVILQQNEQRTKKKEVRVLLIKFRIKTDEVARKLRLLKIIIKKISI